MWCCILVSDDTIGLVLHLGLRRDHWYGAASSYDNILFLFQIEDVKLEAAPEVVATAEEVLGEQPGAPGTHLATAEDNLLLIAPETAAAGVAAPKADWTSDDFSTPAGATTDSWGGEASWA